MRVALSYDLHAPIEESCRDALAGALARLLVIGRAEIQRGETLYQPRQLERHPDGMDQSAASVTRRREIEFAVEPLELGHGLGQRGQVDDERAGVEPACLRDVARPRDRQLLLSRIKGALDQRGAKGDALQLRQFAGLDAFDQQLGMFFLQRGWGEPFLVRLLVQHFLDELDMPLKQPDSLMSIDRHDVRLAVDGLDADRSARPAKKPCAWALRFCRHCDRSRCCFGWAALPPSCRTASIRPASRNGKSSPR